MVNQPLQDLTEADRHRVFENGLRRFIIQLFDETNRPIETSLGELASDIDRSDTLSTASYTGKADLLIQLHHIHLPMLDDVGLIDYDSDTKEIHVTDPESLFDVPNNPTLT
jgi:hypothetical protein